MNCNFRSTTSKWPMWRRRGSILNCARQSARSLLEKYAALGKEHVDRTHGVGRDKKRFPLLAAYDLCLKCSHLFNILDARGAISVTERVGVIARVRALAVGIAKAFVDQQRKESLKAEQQPVADTREKKKDKKKAEVAPTTV